MRIERLWRSVTIAIDDHWQDGIPDRVYVGGSEIYVPDKSTSGLIKLLAAVGRELGFKVEVNEQPHEIIVVMK